MSTFITCDGATLFYRDWGGGQPIVFSHGWPLSADAWDAQMMFFVMRGYRVIAHDRRGHGRSEQTSDHNDMDSYADDLADPGSPHGLAQTQPLEFNADLLAFIEGFGAQRAAPAAAPSGP